MSGFNALKLHSRATRCAAVEGYGLINLHHLGVHNVHQSLKTLAFLFSASIKKNGHWEAQPADLPNVETFPPTQMKRCDKHLAVPFPALSRFLGSYLIV